LEQESWLGEHDAYFARDCLPKYDTDFKEAVGDLAEVMASHILHTHCLDSVLRTLLQEDLVTKMAFKEYWYWKCLRIKGRIVWFG